MDSFTNKYPGRYLKVTFSTGELLIELLQTPLVEKWLIAHNAYKELIVPSVVTPSSLCGLGGSWRKNDERQKGDEKRVAVEKINNAIDKTNSVIDGMEFPYRAYFGMPWMQTNRIHRCFTTGDFTQHCWLHNFTQDQLLKSKVIGSNELRLWMEDNTAYQFKVLDKDIFSWQLHLINRGVHNYEDLRHSIIAEKTINDYVEKFGKPPGNRKQIMWNKIFTFTEDKTCLKEKFTSGQFLQLLTIEEVLSSFPDNYEDYNVCIHKSIGGKDYETCYQQYDDGFEADIRNVDAIDGCITIYPDNEHYKFFTGTRFYQWAKNHDLRDELFLNPPIGKIIEDTVDIGSTDSNTEVLDIEIS